MSKKLINPKLNVVFTGFSYPHGMAGTRRNQHVIDALIEHTNVSARVLVLRQSTKINTPHGVHEGVPYETIGPDLWRIHFLLTSPMFFLKSMKRIQAAFCRNAENMFYIYGPPTFEKLPIIWQAHKCGYKIIFDIVEDYDAVAKISSKISSKVTNFSARWLSKRLLTSADGIIVVSSYLWNKLTELTRGKTPILLHPISVDTASIPYKKPFSNNEISLFYAGIFGVKDGVENLLEAFDSLASSYPRLKLVLSGAGDSVRMKKILDRINCSPFYDRINYVGYLSEEQYLHLLCSVDIPCVPRVDSLCAHAGFPFKLGEFLASGKPVIASKVSDIEDFISDRQHAVLVKPGSADEIASGVRFLIENPTRAIQIGVNGRQKATESFDVGVQKHYLYDFLSMVAHKSSLSNSLAATTYCPSTLKSDVDVQLRL